MTPNPTARRVAVVVAAALLGGVATSWWLSHDRAELPQALPTTRTAFPSVPTPPRPAALPDDLVSTAPTRIRPINTAAPTELRIPSLDLRMTVGAFGVDPAGAMALPATPFTAAWYRYSSRPLDATGATFIAGHVDTADDGAGPLAQLADLRPGAEIDVRATQRVVTYRVDQVRQVEKTRVDLAALFSRDGPARLHLVTCGGPYLPDAGGYQANVVIIASRV